MEPFTFNAVRNIIGGLTLLPCIFFLGRREPKEKKIEENPKTLLIGGILCGTVLCIASNLQQIGINYTTVGKAGFITAMYIVLVPILGIFLKRRAGIKVWISVFLAVAGLYLLCMTEKLSPWEKEMPWCFSARWYLPSTFWSSIIFRRRWTGVKLSLHPVSGLRRVVRHSHVSL